MVLLSDSEKEDYKRIKQLYLKAFPAEERAPFGVMMRRVRLGKAEMLNIMDGDTWIGFVYMVCNSSLAYIFYFAVDEKYRGEGYGTQAIKDLQERYSGRRVFLALEDWTVDSPNKEQRIKRHEFYKNCGLLDLPHKIKEASVVFSIMGSGGMVEPHEYRELIENWQGSILKHLVDMRIIKD